MLKRTIFNFITLGAVLCLPWWLVLLSSGVGVFIFPFYYEIIIWGFLMDLLYGVHPYLDFGMSGFISALGIFALMLYVKQNVVSS